MIVLTFARGGPVHAKVLPMNAPFLTHAVHAARTECGPYELPQALDWFAGIEVLSLDCFDTLLWRDCHAPADLFAVLPTINAAQRMHGEARARQTALATRGAHDVGIDAIYRAIMPRAGEADRARAVAAELATEAQHCYGFGPTIALMRAARQRGMSIVIVSDTYLDPRQLRDLIARAAGADVAGMIDRIFCSSTFGRPKAAGLYREVLAKLKVAPQRILHVGDNAAADVAGVAPFGVQTLHLQQFVAPVARQLRLESAVAAMMHGHASGTLLTPQPHRAALATELPGIADPARRFGFTTLGPVFFGFDQWLTREAQTLQQAHGGRVHWLFIMRDGYLPMRVHQALHPDNAAHAIEISRLTATFASFANEPAIVRHVEDNRGIDPAIIAAQLRLTPEVIADLCHRRSNQDGWHALHAWCQVAANRRPIVRAAQIFAARMVDHVRSVVAPAAGDTLMLIDLGYNGSVQTLIDPLLLRALNVQVAGRYLILRETQVSGCDKRGYLGDGVHDPVLTGAMTANVALIEQLATATQGSVIDYSETGAPLRGANDIAAAQGTTRQQVQAGCLAFAKTALAHGVRVTVPDPIGQWRAAIAATLLRLMFLPMREELAVVRAFEHDVNLGTRETLPLFDPAIARKGLLQQGLFYQKGARRMFLAGELADEGFATRLTHLATARFAMPLIASDFADDAGHMPVTLSHAGQEVQITLPLRPTHDGFMALCIPVGPARYAAAFAPGAVAPYWEVQSITMLPAEEYLSNRHDTAARETAVTPQFDGIVALRPTLWHCPTSAGRALLVPPPVTDAVNRVIVVVLRAISG